MKGGAFLYPGKTEKSKSNLKDLYKCYQPACIVERHIVGQMKANPIVLWYI
jgi:hypothetical protein